MMVARCYPTDTRDRTADHLRLRPEQVEDALRYASAYPMEINRALAENDAVSYDDLKRRFPGMTRTRHSTDRQSDGRVAGRADGSAE